MVHPAESTHYYTKTGEPAFTLVGKNGRERPVTLADARKLDLVPSVTTIIRCAAAPALTNWLVDQGILAALTLPRRDKPCHMCNDDWYRDDRPHLTCGFCDGTRRITEPEVEWLARVKQDSQEQGRAAAERGTEIHARIEAYYRGEGVRATDPCARVVTAVANALCDRYGIGDWEAECAFAHPLGFGGKADLLGSRGDVLLDLKTKDPWQENYPPKGFDEQAMQLAAYRVGLGREQATCANVFVSRQEPWQVHIHEWSEDDIQRGWLMFRNLLWFHQAKTGYDASWEREGELDAIAF